MHTSMLASGVRYLLMVDEGGGMETNGRNDHGPNLPGRKILITGYSGFVGRAISPYLEASGYELRGYDLYRSDFITDSFEGDLTDLERLKQAADGVDCIIHLAACSDDADFISELVPANVVGAFNVFEAAKSAGVKNLILASSCQVADLFGRKKYISVEDRFPTNHYGLTKLWAEDLAQMYSRNFGIAVLAVRLGWVVRSPVEFNEMKSTPGGKELFLSHNDLRRFFGCCLRAKLSPFSIVYAFSKQKNLKLLTWNRL